MRSSRILIVAAIAAVCTIALGAPAGAAKKVLVLGVDGLDPVLLRQFAADGDLPNIKRLLEEGDFKPLQTTMPPLSPVAWSSFITGMDPGGHGIFDFIHRDPERYLPTPAMSESPTIDLPLKVGSCEYPLPWAGADPVNLRKGRAFWELLAERDIPSTLFRIPADFPPTRAGRVLSGMGAPDLIGTHGTFSFYTNRLVPNPQDITGGRIFPLQVSGNKIVGRLVGPEQPFKREERWSRRGGEAAEYEHPDMKELFTIYLDPERPIAKLVVQDSEFILEQGEWSDWVRVEFEVDCVPMTTVSSIARFYMKQVRPEFELYVTPLQINPEDPVFPISHPDDWAFELYEDLGHFYTQELPEDTKALSGGILDGLEFRDQSEMVHRERMKALDHLLAEFDEGFLFFYFSSVDQRSHMLWRYSDPEHPFYEEHEVLAGGIREIYREIDVAVGNAQKVMDDDDTLIVMSDHGFGPFYWGVNLNTWLLEQGYTQLKNPALQEKVEYLFGVDWNKTRAYALGLNGLYINLQGRESNGIVAPDDYQALLDQIEKDLLALRDPRTGQQVVSLVIQTHRDFHGDAVEIGPDIIVGYNHGYRSSWVSPLGEFPREVFVDNLDPWSGDHLVDYRLVPGVLLTNQRITMDEPALHDLTVGILDEYGIPKLPEMLGQDCLGDRETTDRAQRTD